MASSSSQGLAAAGHETLPPPRYTDASLVKRLEEDGIGRPSTYASIISTIERRGYVWRQGKALVPSFTAYAVTHLLKEHFAALVELGFTGLIEEGLDEISKGERDRDEFLATFYNGGGRDWPGLRPLVEKVTEIDYPIISLGGDADGGEPVVVRIGKFGPYVQIGEGDGAMTASIPDDTPPADFSREDAVALAEARAKGPSSLGTDEKTGQAVYVMSGRFGPYVQLGETPEKGSKEKPRRASLTRDDDPSTITLDRALELLALPRLVGRDPSSGEEIVANFGRFGPYVKRGSDFRSLDGDAQVFEVTLDQALELFSREKPSRRSAGRKVLRALGAHPGSGAPVQLLEGRYGQYVTDGTTNASLPKDASGDSLTLDAAVELLRAREGTKPSGRARTSGGRRTTRSPKRKASAPKRSA